MRVIKCVTFILNLGDRSCCTILLALFSDTFSQNYVQYTRDRPPITQVIKRTEPLVQDTEHNGH